MQWKRCRFDAVGQSVGMSPDSTDRPLLRPETGEERVFEMLWRCTNNLIVASIALAAAGILTCTMALLIVFMPQGSVIAQLTTAALLVILVGGAVIGFTWACDKCESYLHEQVERTFPTHWRRKFTVTVKELGPDGRSDVNLPQPARFRNEYPMTLHGLDPCARRTVDFTAARAWRGQ